MKNRFLCARLLVAAACVCAAANSVHAQVPAVPDTFDLVYLGDKAPVLLRLHFTVDGQPLQERWTKQFRAFFRLLDRDRNGWLSAEELVFAPKAQFFAQTMLRGYYVPNRSISLTPAELGKEQLDQIRYEDFVAHYAKHAGPMQLAKRVVNYNTTAISESLFTRLDADNDKRLSRFELERASTVLNGLDLDDDEVIAAAEIVPVANPYNNQIVIVNGAGGMMGRPTASAKALPDSFFHVAGPNTFATLGTLLLTHYDRDRNTRILPREVSFTKEVFAKLDRNEDGELDAGELAQFSQRIADCEWIVKLADDAKKIDWSMTPIDADKKHVLSVGTSQISLLPPPAGPLLASNLNYLKRQFDSLDKDKKGVIDLTAFNDQRFRYVSQMFAIVDFDNDNKVTLKELNTYSDFLEGFQQCQVSLHVIEQGRTFFQMMDTNRDGRLSQRELRYAWSNLQKQDLNNDGHIDNNEIPNQFQIAFNPSGATGYNMSMINNAGARPASPSVPGPTWFQKMDVNRDGDVSPREFLGSAQHFARIDTNSDGLIDLQEAVNFDKKNR